MAEEIFWHPTLGHGWNATFVNDYTVKHQPMFAAFHLTDIYNSREVYRKYK